MYFYNLKHVLSDGDKAKKKNRIEEKMYNSKKQVIHEFTNLRIKCEKKNKTMAK